MQMYVASAGDSNANGIYRCELNVLSGELQIIEAVETITDCLYLAVHATSSVLYAVGEGHIYAFRIASDGSLSFINRQPTGGEEPCYVSVSPCGVYVLVANYTGADNAGSLAVFPLQKDGGIVSASQKMRIPHSGAGVHPQRQDASHPHMIVPTPDDVYSLVPDLGTDKVMIYRLDRDSGQLNPHVQPHIDIEAGSGPRHLVFHPNHRVFYVLSELKPVLSVVAYDASGHFNIVRRYPSLPQDSDIQSNYGADIHVTASGRFLYASNRGHNSLVIYAIDPVSTSLMYAGHQSTMGDWPRAFALDPSNRVLIAANQNTNDLHTFYIDRDTGSLTPNGYKKMIHAPCSIKFPIHSTPLDLDDHTT
jgi:6-phosphogluconolactonase